MDNKHFLYAFLAFSVLNSKDIIIYNEETGIAVSFLAFILFIMNSSGKTTKESLEEKSTAILTELQNSGTEKHKLLHQVLSEHRKVPSNRAFPNFEVFTSDELHVLQKVLPEQTLISLFSNQIQQKLKRVLQAQELYNYNQLLSNHLLGKAYQLI